MSKHATYLRRYNKTAIGFLRLKYIKMLQRVRGHNGPKDHNYVGLEILDRETFLLFASHDPKFWELWNKYRESDWQYGACPSIDRIDQDRGYTLDNIRFITMRENQIRGREKQWRNHGKQQSEGQCTRARSEEAPRSGGVDGLSSAPQTALDKQTDGNDRGGHLRLRSGGKTKGRAHKVDTGRGRRREVKKGGSAQ